LQIIQNASPLVASIHSVYMNQHRGTIFAEHSGNTARERLHNISPVTNHYAVKAQTGAYRWNSTHS